MRSFIFATGKRTRDERRLEDGIEGGEDGMMHDTVAYSRLVNATLFGIADSEGAVGTMFIGTGLQLTVKLEEILFEPGLELHHVFP